MTTAPAPLSIRELPSLETGGIEAREGFNVQDHVAAGFCIRMLSDPSLLEVWCESQDDVTLIWKAAEVEEVEFVQVKKNEHDQLWSIALLCARVDGRVGTSIVEKSLANDRCLEACRFRIVTCRPAKKELGPLTLPIDDESRTAMAGEHAALVKELGNRVGGFKSKNGHGHEFWAARVYWEAKHSIESIEDANLRDLQKVIESGGEPFYQDRLSEVYARILTKVRDAAVARSRRAKKLVRAEFKAWFDATRLALVKAGASGGSKALREKLQAANLSADVVESAVDLRRRYRVELARTAYTEERDDGVVETEVSAVLLRLRSRLDAGLIADAGPEFHAECLDQIASLEGKLPVKSPVTYAQLLGCMYSIAGRCGHRFRKAS